MQAQLIDFRYLNTSDSSDLALFNDGLAWSRVYEYPLALRFLKQHSATRNLRIHNSSWGFQGIHVAFKNILDHSYDAMHSDIRPSALPNTFLYDITKNEPKLHDQFDVVMNISTFEEVPFDPLAILQHLLAQVRVGGFLFLTFDVPGLNLPRVEEFLGQKIGDSGTRICGNNSVLRNPVYGELNCGVLSMRRAS